MLPTIHHRELEGIEEIRGCFLAPKFHPLLDDSRVVDQLNMASWPAGINVGFCAEIPPETLLARVAACPRDGFKS